MFDFQPTILIIEDDANIRRFVRQALESEGCAVYEADTVKRGLIEAGTRQPDAVVLDLGLPDEDGMTLIRELRGWTEVPVLVLSARTAEADKVAALDAGADDYLTKPFGVSELLARLRAVVRRSSNSVVSVLRCRDVQLDPARRVVTRAGAEVVLSASEYRTLLALMERAGQTVSREQLEAAVYGGSGTIESNTVAVYVHQLRRKLGDDLVATVHGLGYRIAAADAA